MTPEERAAAAAITRLRAEIAEDRALMSRCLEDAEQARTRIGVTPDDHAVLALGAVALHGWYTGLETLLERIARQLDGSVPAGQRWHRELLTQMTIEMPRTRPAVLPRALVGDLAELLAFRHFFRHAYGIVLDRARIESRLLTLVTVASVVSGALDAFEAFLVAAAGE